MSIDFKQLQTMVKEAMFTGGGINEPSYPEGVPIRMPAADTETKEPDKGDAKANDLYEMARIAREATEKLVEALDEPIYDGAYEHAFKASACLRRALNAIEETGAHATLGGAVYNISGVQCSCRKLNPYSGGRLRACRGRLWA